ncbi:hypothetical protein TNCV_4469541 [Trichonephila clavipes]|nr:hypothetical protein TNCV_4469541 [Trichonephila clavipes]
MPSPCSVQFCDAHIIIANGQYSAVRHQWTHTTGLRAYSPPPQNVWQQFFGRSAFLRQQETDCHPLSCGAPVPFFADRTIYLSSAGVVLLTRPPRAALLHIPVVLNDFHSRETTL